MRLFKSFCLIVLPVLAIGILTNPGIADEKSWTYNGVEYKLPRPIEEVQLPGELPEYHVVVPGDCLWFISNRYLNDAFLWPIIWEENLDTISNPHLIYPDQHVKLPGGMLVATGERLPGEIPVEMPGDSDGSMDSDGSEDGLDVIDLEDSSDTPDEPKEFAVTSETDVIASGFISKDKLTGPVIKGAETESFDLSTSDIVIVGSGSGDGLEPEQEYFVVRKMHKVIHPISNQFLGYMYHIMAEVEVLCVNETTSSGVIGMTYHPVIRGDFLVPREEIPIPMTLGSPPTDPCNPSSKKFPGTIIDTFMGGPQFSDAVAIARGDIAYLDLGSKDGVAPGDYFTIFKQNLDDTNLPRYVAGELMIVKVSETTSVSVLTQSKTAIFIGDQIELK